VGFERVALFGLIDLELDASLGGSLTLSTDLPGEAMAQRESKAIPVTGRRVVRFRLKGSTKGRLYAVQVAPAGGGTMRLYGGRIWARVLPGAEWAWYPIPIPPTSEWQESKLPIPETSDWAPLKLPIPPVSDWAPLALPIPPTSEWTPVKLPIKPTPENPEWVSLEIDQ
jgi:hypothetical protein